MKYKYVALMLFCAPALKAQHTTEVSIKPGSTFQLNGTSNVNRFTCRIKNGIQSEAITACYTRKDKAILFDDTSFELSVAQFDCKNSRMTQDLKNALKEEAFPKMQFKLLEVYKKSCQALVSITIAGQTNVYLLNYKLVSNDAKSFSIQLQSDFLMTDFSIAPPTAMMGLIKVNDRINIDLKLRLGLE